MAISRFYMCLGLAAIVVSSLFVAPFMLRDLNGALERSVMAPATVEDSHKAALSELSSKLSSLPASESLLIVNTVLREAIAEAHELQKKLSEKLELLITVEDVRDDVIEFSLKGSGAFNKLVESETGLEKEEGKGGNATRWSEAEIMTEASEKVQERLQDCLATRDEHDRVYQNLTTASQWWLMSYRESVLKEHEVAAAEFLHPQREWWLQQGLGSGQEGLDRWKSLPKGEEKSKLNEFLFRYLANEKVWDPHDPDSLDKCKQAQDLANADLERRRADRDDLNRTWAGLQAKLAQICGIEVAHYNWMEYHDKVVEGDALLAESLHHAANPECVDWDTATPNHRATAGIAAPDPLWKMDASLYPNPAVNVTFILEYFRQAEAIFDTVDRLFRCTEGRSGTGELKGLTSTLLVNVDQPGEFETWYDAWKKTDHGSFLVPLFSHNVHEARGYNKLAKAARGTHLVFLQDNDVPPESCDWLRKALAVEAAWPRVAVVGMRNERLSALKFDRAEVLNDLHLQGSKEYGSKKLFDPTLNTRMRFASVVDVGPLLVKKSQFLELGGFNEGLCKKGNPCSLLDWDLGLRAWMAGYQVVHLDLEDDISFHASPNAVVPGTRELATARQNVEVNLVTLEEVYGSFKGIIVKEVKRLNSHLVEVV